MTPYRGLSFLGDSMWLMHAILNASCRDLVLIYAVLMP
jgi:hypothetical protein